jgi:hypothetical protein
VRVLPKLADWPTPATLHTVLPCSSTLPEALYRCYKREQPNTPAVRRNGAARPAGCSRGRYSGENVKRTLLASCCVAATVISGASLFTSAPAHAWRYRQYGYYDYRPFAFYHEHYPYAYHYAYPPYAYTYGYRPYTYSGYVHAGFGWTGRHWW